MSAERLSMRKIKEILRLKYAAGLILLFYFNKHQQINNWLLKKCSVQRNNDANMIIYKIIFSLFTINEGVPYVNKTRRIAISNGCIRALSFSGDIGISS